MQLPINHILEIAGLIVLGVVVATPLIMLNIRVAPLLGLIDWPKARGMAEEQIPIIGPALVLLSTVLLFYLTNTRGLSPWILTTSLVMAVMGYLDDRKPLSAVDKIFFQAICAATVVFLDPAINKAVIQIHGPLGAFMAFFFVVGLINAVNFIDGIDGLAGTVLLIGTAGLLMLSHRTPDMTGIRIFGAVLIGALIPFLFFNIKKRKGFLGNVGSYFFSYVLAMMHMSLPLNTEDVVSRFSLSALCFLIPGADALMVIVSRASTKRSPFSPDKGHLHHRLVQTGIHLHWILCTFGVIEATGVFAAYMFERTPGAANSFLPTMGCLSYVGISGLLIVFLEKASKKRIQLYFKRLDEGKPIYYIKYEIKNENGSPITRHQLRRLEARVSAEIRVSDLCYSEQPNLLYVSLTTLAEPLKGISARLETIFETEKVLATHVLESGQVVKIQQPLSAVQRPTFVRKKAS